MARKAAPKPKKAKPWVEALLQHGDAISDAIGERLGLLLGCGHWGCVIDLPDSPWVLKLTLDPTEAFVWQRIDDIIQEEGYGQGGFTRVRSIYKLDPKVQVGSRNKQAYAIVREKAAPVFHQLKRGGQLVTTLYTMARIGLSQPVNYYTLTHMTEDVPGFNYQIAETQETLEALTKYRWAARGLIDKVYGSSERVVELATYAMHGAIGGPIGESLGMILNHGLILQDVHSQNIGWREIEDIAGDYENPCIVIFDPGHTPTEKKPLEQSITWRKNPVGDGADFEWFDNPIRWNACRNPAADVSFYFIVAQKAFALAGYERVQGVELKCRKLQSTPRHFAQTREDGFCIEYDKALSELPERNIAAIMAHEMGHAADFIYNGPPSEGQHYETESRADELAESVFRRRIGYTGPLLLQCFSAGVPRPKWL